MSWTRAQAFLRTPGPVGVDGAIAIAVGIALQIELWLGEHYQGALAFPGSKAATAPFLVLAAVALAWRRLRPIASCAGVMAALALQSLATGGTEAGGVFFLLMLSVYSAAAYAGSLWAVAGLAAVAVAAHDLRDPSIHGVGDALFGAIFAAVGLALGRAMHARGAQNRLLEARAHALAHAREEGIRRAVDDERERLARDLHDIVAHNVSMIVLQAEAGQTLGAPDAPASRMFSAIERSGRQAMTELRRVLSLMREHEEPLDPPPGIERIDELVERTRAAGVRAELSVEGPARTLPPGIDVTAYRVVQEGLTNALKHAPGARVRVRVGYSPDAVLVEVVDSGTTSASNGASGGYGLVGMRERVMLCGGTLEAAPDPSGSGFALRARLPTEAESA